MQNTDEQPIIDDEVCRICRQNATVTRPLYHPCNCSGSIRHVHEDCLIQWINHSKNQTCELCKQQFHFTNIYADNAPQKLSIFQVLFGAVQMGAQSVNKFLRIILVVFMWTFVTPLLTAWLWKLYFSKSMTDVTEIFSRFSTAHFGIFKDCLIGSVLSILILIFGLVISGVKEFVNTNIDLLNEHVNQQPLAVDEIDEEDEYDSGEDSDDIVQAALVHEQPPPIRAQHQQQDDVDLEEMFGFRGPIFTLFESCLMIVLSNAIHLLLFVFTPLNLGRLCVMLFPEVEPYYYGEITDIALGYLTLLCILMIVITGNVILYQLFGKPRIWKVTKFVVRGIRYGVTLIKIISVMLFSFFITPWILGISMNLTTSEFFNITVEERIQQLWPENYADIEFTALFGIHWILGVVFLYQISTVVRSLRTIIYGPRCLWFFNNPDDPNFEFLREVVTTPVLKHVRRVISTLFMFNFFILAVVRAPMKLARNLTDEYLFPLKLDISDPFLSLSINIVLLTVLSHLTFLERLRPRERIYTWTSMWITKIGQLLGLTNYLFDDGTDPDVPIYPDMFSVRIVGLLTMAWSTLVIIFTTFIIVPLATGRFAVQLVVPMSFISNNDIYCHVVGLYIVGAIVVGLTQVWQLRRIHSIFFILLKYGIIAAKCLCFLSMAGAVIPFLVGILLYTCLIVPLFFLPLQRTPLYLYSEIWGIGIIASVFAVRFIFMFKIKPLHTEFEHVKHAGIHDMDLARVMSKIVIPIVYAITLFICTPYILAHVTVGDYIVPYLYPLLLVALIVIKIAKMCMASFTALHDRVKNEKYLVRRALVNK